MNKNYILSGILLITIILIFYVSLSALSTQAQTPAQLQTPTQAQTPAQLQTPTQAQTPAQLQTPTGNLMQDGVTQQYNDLKVKISNMITQSRAGLDQLVKNGKIAREDCLSNLTIKAGSSLYNYQSLAVYGESAAATDAQNIESISTEIKSMGDKMIQVEFSTSARDTRVNELNTMVGTLTQLAGQKAHAQGSIVAYGQQGMAGKNAVNAAVEMDKLLLTLFDNSNKLSNMLTAIKVTVDAQTAKINAAVSMLGAKSPNVIEAKKNYDLAIAVPDQKSALKGISQKLAALEQALGEVNPAGIAVGDVKTGDPRVNIALETITKYISGLVQFKANILNDVKKSQSVQSALSNSITINAATFSVYKGLFLSGVKASFTQIPEINFNYYGEKSSALKLPLETCQTTCAMDPRCMGVELNKTDSTCMTFTSMENPKDPANTFAIKPSISTQMFIKKAVNGPLTSFQLNGLNAISSGGISSISNMTKANCQSACEKDNACQLAHWRPPVFGTSVGTCNLNPQSFKADSSMIKPGDVVIVRRTPYVKK